MKRVFACILLSVLCLPSALAWGFKGHELTCTNAVILLPDGPLRSYMITKVLDIRESSLVPDKQLKEGVSYKLEAPNHYLDLEILSPNPTAADVPRTAAEAMRLYTAKDKFLAGGGLLPWRVEEVYLRLVNAFRADQKEIPFYAGLLAHYAADTTMPLHTTIHFNGRVDRRVNGRKFLEGIHADYEIAFIEDSRLEFARSSMALARPAEKIEDVFARTVDILLESHTHVDRIYAVAEKHQGKDKFVAWDQEMGQLTRSQLATASSVIADLWLTAWLEAGSPGLPR